MLEISLKFNRSKGVCDYCVLFKKFPFISERKHEHFTRKKKIGNNLTAHDHKRKPRVNKKNSDSCTVKKQKFGK